MFAHKVLKLLKESRSEWIDFPIKVYTKGTREYAIIGPNENGLYYCSMNDDHNSYDPKDVEILEREYVSEEYVNKLIEKLEANGYKLDFTDIKN